MSTILKALRRLEEERSFEQTQSLRDHVLGGVSEQPKQPSRLGVFGIIGVGFASAAAGGLAFALWSTGRLESAAGPENMASPPAVAAAPSAATPVNRSAALEAEVVDELGSWTGESRGVSRGDEAVESPATSLRPSSPVSQIAKARSPGSIEHGTSKSATDPAAAARELAVTARRNLTPEEPQVRIEFADDVAVVTFEEVAVPTIEAPSIPRAIEPASPLSVLVKEPLRVIRRARLPKVEVVQTIWHPQPARRLAVLRLDREGEVFRVGEGDAVGALVLLEIQPAGVVFTHEGTQIQRRVGDRSGL